MVTFVSPDSSGVRTSISIRLYPEIHREEIVLNLLLQFNLLYVPAHPDQIEKLYTSTCETRSSTPLFPASHSLGIRTQLDIVTTSYSLLPIHFPQYPLLPFFLGSPKPISTLSWILEYACSSRISYIWAKNTQRNLADTKSSQDSSNGHSETHQRKRPQRWSLRSGRANM